MRKERRMIGFKPILAILFFCAVLGAAMVGAFVLPNQQPNEREKSRRRTFERTIAEGMRLYNQKTGVDSIHFDSCRIEKMKIGECYLGMLNVLCLDGLVLNLPFPAEAEDSGVNSEECCKVKNGGCEAVDAFAGLLPSTFLQLAGVSVGGLSGVRINGLSVNRVENRCEVPVFAADKARNYGPTLKLRNCRVFESGRTNSVGVAYLVLHPEPVLVWKDGRRKLDDLFPKLPSEMKGKEQ